ncbi:MAG: hypothetical protein K2K97_01070 [Muribaculaceae bacterium]|nr:hypothetical protein [Muribaculaceae bacterium]
MRYTDLIFYGAILILCGILLYCCWLMLGAFRKKTIPIAYAGTAYGKRPVSTKVNAKAIDILIGQIKTNTEGNGYLRPFMVEGDSMQYADIHNGDIVLTEKPELNNGNLPKVVVIKDVNSDSNESFKLRRAWKVITDDIDILTFRTMIDCVVDSEKFKEVKNLVGEKCPTDTELKDEIIGKFTALKMSAGRSYLISTTYRTREKKIGFSIHNFEDVVGMVTFIASKKERSSKVAIPIH